METSPTSDVLSPLEARVLGCLIEKELSTPEYYPLTLNALVNACNQKSNRDPLLALAAGEVELAIDTLRQRRLATLFSGADARVPKYKHTLDSVYPMETADRAVLAELLLRGPQTSGELRGRCERMHLFSDAGAVDETLARLAGRAAGPLVVRMSRQPGQKEARWAQLLTGEPAAVTDAAAVGGEHAPREPLRVEMKLPAEAEARLAALEAEVARLRGALDDLRRQLGAG